MLGAEDIVVKKTDMDPALLAKRERPEVNIYSQVVISAKKK